MRDLMKWSLKPLGDMLLVQKNICYSGCSALNTSITTAFVVINK